MVRPYSHLSDEQLDVAILRQKEQTMTRTFDVADMLREKILRMGYTIEDTPLGPFIWPTIS